MVISGTREILLVDDSVDQQILLVTLLESNGFKVHCTSNGAEALELLENCQVLPELILLDLEMPRMDGREFRSAQAENPKIREIPVVLISGHEDIESVQRSTSSVGFLRKPFNIASIVETIRKTLQ